VTSPGVPEGAEILRWAEQRGLPTWSELELGARLCRVPYIAVTGTNGKTTTTELVASSMRAAGLRAVACGNIGHPFSLAVQEGYDALAVEASSFQLRFSASLHPRVSALLNLAEDHLDWHASPAAYAVAKARIHRLQGPGDVHVGNRDDPRAAAISAAARCRRVWFRLGAPDADEIGYAGDSLVARLERETVVARVEARRGSAFRADAAAAAAIALAFGIPAPSIADAIDGFSPPPHRGRVVATVRGVRFVDDSKATNPHAALAALEAVDDAVLIAGGRAKGVDLSPLAASAPRLAAVVAIGEAAVELQRVFGALVPVRTAASIEEAVRTAFALAPPNGIVLLAPACASQDMFRDYRERGDRFAAAAAELSSEVATLG
jgi:UDP-N-acetylmuramoylalanine--D-glutamate ligase